MTLVGYHARTGRWRAMIDREKVITVLHKRFPGATADQVAAAANAIVGLGEEWREVETFEADLERHITRGDCGAPHCFVERLQAGHHYKLLEKLDE